MKHQAKLAAGALLLVLLLTSTIASAASAGLVSAGGGRFLLNASGMQNIAGFEIVIKYDTKTLASPQVEKGNLAPASSFIIGNETVAGTYNVALVGTAPINGTGTLAILTFKQLSAVPGAVSVFSQRFIENTDKGGDAKIDSLTATPPEAGTGETSSGQGSDTKGLTTRTTINTGTVTFPTEGAVQPDRIKEMPLPPATKPEPAPVALSVPRESESATQGKGTAPPPPANKGGNFSVQKSVLNRFKEFEGTKTPQALMALFSQPGGAAVSQEPAVALADGVALVKISVKTGAPVQAPPTFALKGASIVSQRQGEKGTWIIEARPKKGALQASVTLLTNDAMTEYPLVVAPAVDIDLAKTGKISEEDFILFLKDSAPPPAPVPATPAVPVPTASAPSAGSIASSRRKLPAGKPASNPLAAQSKEAVPAVPPATLASPAAPLPAAAVEPAARFDLNGDGRHDYIDDYIYTANYLARLTAEPKAPAKDLK